MHAEPGEPTDPEGGTVASGQPVAPGAHDDGASPGGGVPVEIRPPVAIVLILGGVAAIASLILDLTPAWRYGIVGGLATLYFLTKVKHWL